ncbi:MAG: prepilin peptidase [Candidatus Woesearchaeota archaeon]
MYLILIILLGLLTSYTDIRHGKIKNVILILFFVAGLILNFQLSFSFLLSLLISIVIGYLLWDLGFWTAADGKLFTVFSVLIPLGLYAAHSSYVFSSSVNILINTFVPMFAFFLMYSISKTPLLQMKVIAKRVFAPGHLLNIFLSIFVFALASDLLHSYIGITLDYFISLVVLFVMYSFVMWLPLSRKQKLVGLVIFLVLSLFTISIMDFLISVFFFFAAFVIFRAFALEMGFDHLTVPVRIVDLKPGMVLADTFYAHKETVVKRRALFTSFFSYLRERGQEKFIDPSSEGIKRKDIRKLKDLAKKHPTLTHVRVHQTIPFAPFLFAGVILTVFFEGSMLGLL